MQTLKRVLNFTGTDSFGVKQQDLLLYAGDTLLVFLDDQRFKCPDQPRTKILE